MCLFIRCVPCLCCVVGLSLYLIGGLFGGVIGFLSSYSCALFDLILCYSVGLVVSGLRLFYWWVCGWFVGWIWGYIKGINMVNHSKCSYKY